MDQPPYLHLQHLALANKGAGTMIGFLDTSIGFTNRLFRNPNGTTRILGIWDQTLPEDTDELPRRAGLFSHERSVPGTRIHRADQ